MPAYGKVKVDTITYDLSGTATDVSVSNIATKASPTFTGTVTIPTPTAGDNSTKAASTAFVVASFATKASPTFTGTINAADLVLSGDLTVNGSTTTIDTTTLQVEDKNIQIGKVSTPSDITADGGGLTLLGATNKTWNWVNSTDAWTSSEHIHLGDNKKLLVGTGSDLELSHDGNSYINNTTANQLAVQSDDLKLRSYTDLENYLVATHNGSVDIFFNGVKKIETSNTGCTVTGTLAATAVTGDGSGLTNLPPGGNTISLVADGAIAAGKAVIIKSNGKAAQVAISTTASLTLSPNNNGTSLGALGDMASGFTNTMAYDSDSDTVLIVYRDSSNNLQGKLFSQTGNVITALQTTQLENGLSTNHFSVAAISSRRFVVCYKDSTCTRIMLITVNSSGNGFSTSAEATLDGNGNVGSEYGVPCAVETTTNRIVVFSRANNGNCRFTNLKMGLIVGDIGSGSGANWWTYRSALQITTSSGDGQYRTISYDSTNGVIGATFADDGSNVKFVAMKVASGNTATITFGTDINLTTSGSFNRVLYHSNAGSWITACKDSSHQWHLKTQAHTVNSSTLAITSGTAIPYVNAGDPSYGMDIVITNEHQIYFIGTFSNQRIYAVSGTVSGTTLTLYPSNVAEQQSNYGTNNRQLDAVYIEHNNKVLIVNRMTSTYSNAWGYNTSNCTQATTNQTDANQYIGFADQAYSNGQTATINTYGNTVNTLSGLTTGSIYYVQADGTIGTSWDSTNFSSFASNTPVAGMALSATKLLIREPRAMN